MVKEKSGKSKKGDNRILFAFLATFLSIIGFVIALVVKRDDDYVMYYAKQSLIIFIIIAVLGAISRLLLIIPIIGWIIYAAVSIFSFILWVISWVNPLSGMKRAIPIVSEWADKINL